jgi:hypothetical protein
LIESFQKSRGSLPDLRHDYHCPKRCVSSTKYSLYKMHESSGSTESLLEEADEYFQQYSNELSETSEKFSRRCSEADINRGN